MINHNENEDENKYIFNISSINRSYRYDINRLRPRHETWAKIE